MKTARRYPLIAEVNPPYSAAELSALFQDRPFAFFLDSGMDPGKLGRFSFLGSDPFLVVRSRGEEITLLRDGAAETRRGNPFDILGELLKVYALDRDPDLPPLAGGVVGYLSYDLGHFMEKLPGRARDDLQLPESYLSFYDVVLCFDHQTGKTCLVSSGFPELDEERRLRRARERLHETESRLKAFKNTTSPREKNVAYEGLVLRSNFSHENYLRAVAAAREYICAGDIFQVNLSQRLAADPRIPPYELYRRLRQLNPAPFAAYLDLDGVQVVSASPERFLRVTGDMVETRPIKGTRPRGQTPQEDRRNARQLLSSLKDRAENVMIVDLERNDIGRVCRYGTVKVTELAVLETFPTVFHLTSTVVGQLSPGKDRIDLLKATFPGGSITGAPKVRAMEIIDELEPTRRSVYTGSLGYFSFDGGMDLNIVIRTFIIKGQRAYFQAGGGIVYDSEPQSEYDETLDKARALIRALGLSSEVVVEAAP
ncbi:MAG: aminodeoxychorismate synthase component I [Chloroflexota bacterium]